MNIITKYQYDLALSAKELAESKEDKNFYDKYILELSDFIISFYELQQMQYLFTPAQMLELIENETARILNNMDKLESELEDVEIPIDERLMLLTDPLLNSLDD